MANIAESVDDVGSLGETDGGKIELGGVLWQPNLPGVRDSKTALDSPDEASLAVSVEARDKALDDSEKDVLPVYR